MSYHQGYAWNDGIEKGIEDNLKGQCKLKKFYMDTKRNSSKAFARSMADKAQHLIKEYQPDIVIASDDNASKYLVTRYKDSNIPFVFCGVNWTAKAYGFPYSNVTGMVEVAPVLPILRVIENSVNVAKKGVYLSADVITEHKDFVHYKKLYEKRGVQLTAMFVKTMAQWIKAYSAAQTADFIIINNNAGITDWSDTLAIKTVYNNSVKLTVTSYKWMMPFTMFAITKSAEEQGRWSAQVASEILNGMDVADIPITINKEWKMFLNKELLKKVNIKIESSIYKRASTNWQ